MNKLIEVEGGLPKEIYLYQERLAKEMFEKIEVEYGKEILDRIRQVL